MKPYGLYIHIPFCTQKCRYCDFYSITQNARFVPYHRNTFFIERLLEDVRLFKAYAGITVWKTLYIGGGTPSLLSADDMYVLVTEILKEQRETVEECTVEVNPEDIDAEWLAACRSAGVTRLSVGVQSFDTAVLAANGRRGSGKKTVQALDIIKQHWQGALSCDLIAGLTGQSAQSLADDVRRLVDYRIEHLSLYGLVSAEPLSQDREDFIAELLQKSVQLLADSAYVQYEVSNFSYRDTYHSIHNELYWHMEPYVGIGPTACGTLIYEDTTGKFISAQRFTGIKHTDRWMRAKNRIGVYGCEHIDKKTFLEEVLLMGFRLTEGINRHVFLHRFGIDITAYIGNTLLRWEKQGYCRISAHRVELTEEGLLLLNRFLVEAFIELDSSYGAL